MLLWNCEIMLGFNAGNKNQPTHSFMKKHSNKHSSINDCPVINLTNIISKLSCWTTTLLWRKEIFYHLVTHNLALHIETVNLADREYELVLADSCVVQEANLNFTSLAQDLCQAPEVSLPDSAKEGKLRCIIPLFLELLFI